MAFIVQKFHERAWQGNTNVPRELCAGGGVATGRRTGFRQAVAFANGATGFLQPQCSHRTGDCHATAHRHLEIFPIDCVKVRVIGQAIEQGIDRRKTVKCLRRQGFQHSG